MAVPSIHRVNRCAVAPAFFDILSYKIYHQLKPGDLKFDKRFEL